jgi:hypothetical protein
MAKGQKRSNRESKKSKMAKKPIVVHAALRDPAHVRTAAPKSAPK